MIASDFCAKIINRTVVSASDGHHNLRHFAVLVLYFWINLKVTFCLLLFEYNVLCSLGIKSITVLLLKPPKFSHKLLVYQ